MARSLKAFPVLAFVVALLWAPAALSGMVSPPPPLERLTVIAPAAPGSGWDELANCIAQTLMKTGLVRSAAVIDLPGQRGEMGLQTFLREYRGNGNVLLVGGRTLREAPRTASLLRQTIPIARLTGEFEVLAFPAGTDVESMDSVVVALNGKPQKLSRVPLNSLRGQGANLDMANWRGVFAPPGVGPEQRTALEAMIGTLVKTPQWKVDLKRMHWTDFYLSGPELVDFLSRSNGPTKAQVSRGGISPQTSFRWRLQIWILKNRGWLAAGVCFLMAISIGLSLHLRKRAAEREGLLSQELVRAREDVHRSDAERMELLEGVSRQIDHQMRVWGLTDAEQEVALLILKGLRLKEIADLRGTSERTVRQQATTVYKKAGIGGRSDLAAFFLEDFLQPMATHVAHR